MADLYPLSSRDLCHILIYTYKTPVLFKGQLGELGIYMGTHIHIFVKYSLKSKQPIYDFDKVLKPFLTNICGIKDLIMT